MNRRKIVAGNWKMNTDLAEAGQLVKDIIENAPENGVEKIFFPPFPFVKTVADLLSGKSGFDAGAQNCSEHAKGAYTGEVSAGILASVACRYVLVGHSERRTYFKESAEQLAMKIKEAFGSGLRVVFCFGEQLAERKSNRHFETVKQQLEEVLTEFKETDLENMILAYEPVWAIGTGETASPQQAQEMHAFVRACLASVFSEKAAAAMPILYGGSCNAQNAPELFACADVDGGLIGGASLKAADFCKITASFS